MVPECFDPEGGFPLEDELRIEPLSLDGLSMLSDPDMVLPDPSVEDTFRNDRLWMWRDSQFYEIKDTQTCTHKHGVANLNMHAYNTVCVGTQCIHTLPLRLRMWKMWTRCPHSSVLFEEMYGRTPFTSASHKASLTGAPASFNKNAVEAFKPALGAEACLHPNQKKTMFGANMREDIWTSSSGFISPTVQTLRLSPWHGNLIVMVTP